MAARGMKGRVAFAREARASPPDWYPAREATGSEMNLQAQPLDGFRLAVLEASEGQIGRKVENEADSRRYADQTADIGPSGALDLLYVVLHIRFVT